MRKITTNTSTTQSQLVDCMFDGLRGQSLSVLCFILFYCHENVLGILRDKLTNQH